MFRAAIVATLAMLCSAQSDLPPERERLVQIRLRMNENQLHIPNYTCLETIARTSQPPKSLAISRDGGRARSMPQDILRLEVAEVNGKEFFAMPGARNFAETDISTFSTRGMIGNGVFAGFARAVFDSFIADYRFAGETNDAGRPLLRYDYQVPLLQSNYQLKTLRGEAKVAYKGSIWADAKTLDTVRMDLRAVDIPPDLGLVMSTTSIDYAKVHIGAADVLLPQSAEMTMQNVEDWVLRNHIAFTHCKAYSAESEISFNAPAIDPTVEAPPPREIEIPEGLTLATTLDTAIDSENTRVGDPVSAHIEADVRLKRAVLIPKGTVVTGRIRTFDRYTAPSYYFRIAIEFYRLEFPRGPVRFFAEMQKIDYPEVKAPGAGRQRVLKRPAAPRVRLTIVPTPQLPGIATFSIKGDEVRLAPGTRMVWKSRQYGPAKP